jgi:hypothetical protein
MNTITISANTVTGTIEVQTQDWTDDDPRWAVLDRGTYLAVATEVEPWGEGEFSMDKATEAVRDNLGLTVSDWVELPGINGELRFATVASQ